MKPAHNLTEHSEIQRLHLQLKSAKDSLILQGEYIEKYRTQIRELEKSNTDLQHRIGDLRQHYQAIIGDLKKSFHLASSEYLTENDVRSPPPSKWWRRLLI